ncbi:transcription factor TGA4 isoform X2 [Elaeis guineensis]|uniref:transcription factor TGA4 isoform X2 n=1 Tax=Elaeis guineensis var. tenera TaxID=51953 RepID=UPI003C6D38A5
MYHVSSADRVEKSTRLQNLSWISVHESCLNVPNSMSFQSTRYSSCSTMGIYEQNHQVSMWDDSFRADSSQYTCSSTVLEADVKIDSGFENITHETLGSSKKSNQEANKPGDKVLRRLAQNREAARKSRLRKKVYIQQLEESRMKLTQLEQELEQVRQQEAYTHGHSSDSFLGSSGAADSGLVGIAAFEMEYGHWVEEQNRHTCGLRAALHAHVSDLELRILVESGMRHYDELFRIKALAAKSDVFYLMSGMWKTSAERFFLWIGGFRPSEILKVVSPQLDPLTEQQLVAVYNLQQSSQQAEDALSQGLDKLRQTLAETIISDPLDTPNMANYMGLMTNAMGKLEALISFVNQVFVLYEQNDSLLAQKEKITQVVKGIYEAELKLFAISVAKSTFRSVVYLLVVLIHLNTFLNIWQIIRVQAWKQWLARFEYNLVTPNFSI